MGSENPEHCPADRDCHYANSTVKDLSIGISGFTRAFGFAMRNRLWWLFLAPVALWLLFASGILWASHAVVEQVSGWVAAHLDISIPAEDRSGLAGVWDDAKGWFNSTRDLLVLGAVKLALWFLFGLVGKYLVLIVLSPLLAYASERAEEIVTGRTFPFRLGQLVKDIGRGILMAFRNGLLETFINVLIWSATFFIAPLAPVSAIVLWLVSSWFYGFSMFDYIFERQRMGIRASARTAWSRPGVVMANGMLFNFLMDPPFLQWLFGPVVSAVCFCVVPVMAAIGAVLAWNNVDAHGIGTVKSVPMG